jgi:hypothetical protein
MKTQKYHAEPQKTADGYFASKAELKRWRELCLMQQCGDIRDLVRQPSFPLWTMSLAGQRVPVMIGARKAKYIADFSYHEREGHFVVEDVKGVDTPTSKLKRAIVLASLGIDVRLITKRKAR